MSKVTDNWDLWVFHATKLTDAFRLAVEYNQRDDEFAAAWDMMEFLQETIGALGAEKHDGYDGSEGPDKEGWDD